MCVGMHGLIGNQAGNEDPLANIELFRAGAKKMLQRIEVLEKNQLKVVCAHVHTLSLRAQFQCSILITYDYDY